MKTKVILDFNIFEIFYKNGEQALYDKLITLDDIYLKQIISDNVLRGIKWCNTDKNVLVKNIVERIVKRCQKGDVFMNYVR
jgi:hypothetical protein